MSLLPLEERLAILAAGARYDASCASCDGAPRGGNVPSGVCHSWSTDGRCISLLKILLTNACCYDCAYCLNRRSNDQPRTSLTPSEIAGLTVEFYRRNYIEGLFLSTGVVANPDYTMELLIEAARLLRHRHGFAGYIYLKLVPGADPRLIATAAGLADRVSVNIELPSALSLAQIAPDKDKEAILAPMRQIHAGIASRQEPGRGRHRPPTFAPGGQSTQLIVGASPEDDRQILQLATGLYRQMELRRVYYSAYVPLSQDTRVPALAAPPLLREHRLYQADWLLRRYGFTVDELLDASHPHLDLQLDPKAAWALRHRGFFPIEVNRAAYQELLRVPGIGTVSARRIVQARRGGPLHLEDLGRLGVVMKRARWFVTAAGRYGGDRDPDSPRLAALLQAERRPRQLGLFDPPPTAPALPEESYGMPL